jgi:hypothetical protein
MKEFRELRSPGGAIFALVVPAPQETFKHLCLPYTQWNCITSHRGKTYAQLCALRSRCYTGIEQPQNDLG